MIIKHVVLKLDDLKRINKSVVAGLDDIISEIKDLRLKEQRDPSPQYIVINTDEPFINDVITVLKENDRWDPPTAVTSKITSHHYGLTEGKRYKVLFEHDTVYELELDNGKIGCRPKGLFKF